MEARARPVTATDEAPPGISEQFPPIQSIFNHFPEALILTDAEGRIRQLNSLAQLLLGQSHNGLKLDEWAQVFGLYQSDTVTPFRAHSLPLYRALKGESAQEEMFLHTGNDSPGRWISMSSWPVKAGDGSVEGAIVVISDITATKKAQISRERYVHRTETLYRLSKIVASSGNNLEKLVKSVSVLVSRAVGDLTAITLLNQANEKLKIAAIYDPDPKVRSLLRKVMEQTGEFDRDQGLAARAIIKGEPILIQHVSPQESQTLASPAWQEFAEHVGLESILVVPMIGRNGIVGALSVSRHTGHGPYNHADQAFLLEIATRTALGVEYCRLFESLRAEVLARKSAHMALDVSQGRFRAIFEATALGIKILDLDGHILQTNAAYEMMVGREEHELVGGHFTEFIDPLDRPGAKQVFKDIKVNGATFVRFEHRGLHKDGSLIWMKTVFTPVKNTRGDDKNKSPVFIVGIIENISEQKRIQMELAEMSNRLQGSVELERLRLAQELHDNPMQTLYTAIYQIEELRNRAEIDPSIKDALQNVNNDIKTVLDGLRATAKELRPPTLFSFGLEHAIRSHVDDIRDKFPNIKITLSLAHDRQLLPEKARLALFRIAQQSLSNVLRHSEATEAHVRFSFDAEEVRLEVSDNGKGFEVPKNWIELVRSGHFGLAGASERIHALGGSLQVQSQPGQSTVVTVIIPWRSLQE